MTPAALQVASARLRFCDDNCDADTNFAGKPLFTNVLGDLPLE